MSKLNLDAAIAASIRRDNLRFASECGAWVTRKRKTIRIPSKAELEPKHKSGTQTCFHELPYTVACRKCKRSEQEARTNLNKIKAMLSIA